MNATIFVFEIYAGVVDKIHQYPNTDEGKVKAEAKFKKLLFKHYPAVKKYPNVDTLVKEYIAEGSFITEEQDGVQIKYHYTL